jgi:hypothetical protein
MRDGICGGLYGHALLSASSLNTPRALTNGVTTSQSVGRLTSPVAKHVCWLALGAKCGLVKEKPLTGLGHILDHAALSLWSIPLQQCGVTWCEVR